MQKNNSQVKSNIQRYYQKWMVFAPAGLLLIGFGLCVFGTALAKMQENAAFIEWFMWGTGSLVLINGGLCFFGSAIKYSVLYELEQKSRYEKVE